MLGCVFLGLFYGVSLGGWFEGMLSVGVLDGRLGCSMVGCFVFVFCFCENCVFFCFF